MQQPLNFDSDLILVIYETPIQFRTIPHFSRVWAILVSILEWALLLNLGSDKFSGVFFSPLVVECKKIQHHLWPITTYPEILFARRPFIYSPYFSFYSQQSTNKMSTNPRNHLKVDWTAFGNDYSNITLQFDRLGQVNSNKKLCRKPTSFIL